MKQIIVNQIRPFAAEIENDSKLTLINYINVTIDGIEFDLVPFENVGFEIDIPTRKIVNKDGSFAFMSEKGEFNRLSLDELVSVPTFKEALEPIVEEFLSIYSEVSGNKVPDVSVVSDIACTVEKDLSPINEMECDYVAKQETELFLHEVLINKALETNDLTLFNALNEK